MIQHRALRLLLEQNPDARLTVREGAFGTPGPFAQKWLAFAPEGVAPQPDVPVTVVEGSLPVLGGVRMPRGLARGVVQEGRVVAWAVAREPDPAGVCAITVETAPAYRRRGYAKACLLALRRDCAQPLIYLCDARNLHSALTALSAGFHCIGSLERNP